MQGGLLAIISAAVCTALLLTTVAGLLAFGHRADRAAWRTPESVPAAQAEAVLASAYESVGGHDILLVDYAALTSDAPVPPGLPRAPAPGEVWRSPALAALGDDLPPGATTDAGRIGGAGLLHPDELVAVVGRDPNHPRVALDERYAGPSWVTPLDRLPSDASQVPMGGSSQALYTLLAQIAVVLLAVPLLTLGGAAARLGVARRDERLAAMRLVGGTNAQVVTAAIIESLVHALVGTAVGVAAYLALVPVVGLIPFQGGAVGSSDLWLDLPTLLLVTGAVLALSAVSALIGLREVVVSPLGVANRHTPRRLRVLRVVLLAVVLGGWSAFSRDATTTAIVVGLGMVFLTLNVVGPLVLGVVGRIRARTARTPAALLAARRLADDPRGAWRVVGGLALASFVAACVAIVPAIESSADGAELDIEAAMVIQDLRTGGLVVLVVAFLVAAASAGIASAAAVLDRRRTYSLLALAGTDPVVLDRARRRELRLPLLLTAVGSVLTAWVFLLPITGMALLRAPSGLLLIGGSVAVGIAAVMAASEASRPLLRAVLAESTARPD